MTTPTTTLLSILDHYRPERLLCVSAEPVPAALAYCAQHNDCQRIDTSEVPLSAELLNCRYDLAIIADQLERLDKRQGIELLAGLRNLSVSRLAVLVDMQAASAWQDTDFFGLALQRQAWFEQDGRSLTLFTYDLAEYKPAPDWLNSKYWANPQNFGKYWW